MSNYNKKTKAAAPKKPKFGDARDNMDAPELNKKQGMNYRSTMPARTRAGQSHPGGKHMRRQLKKLELSQKMTVEARALAGRRSPKFTDAAMMMPGSMNL